MLHTTSVTAKPRTRGGGSLDVPLTEYIPIFVLNKPWEAGKSPSCVQHLRFPILRVFGPSVPTAEVDAAEAHFKRAMLTRKFGPSRN